MGFTISVGNEFFERIIENGSYYVDKTEFIYKLLHETDNTIALFTRPRRFGKTMMMTTLQSFLDITRSSRELFEGLAVSKHDFFCDSWMNQYPVIFISLKDVDGLNFHSAYRMLMTTIADYCKTIASLSSDPKVNPADAEIFKHLMFKEASLDEVKSSLITIMRMMNAVYGKPVILLIDEYDVPLSKAHENGYYREMLDVIRGLLSIALKTDLYLKKAVITGCLRIAQESIFTGVNNFTSYSVLDDEFSQYFGFSEEEVETMLRLAGRDEHAAEMKEWYDGYIFGSSHVYCPWDVVNHIAALLKQPDVRPKNYWKNSSGNTVIREFVEDENFQAAGKLEILLHGGVISQSVSDQLTYDTLRKSEENLWSVLVMTGYLTKSKTEDTGKTISLKIPNAEIADIFEETVMDHFSETLDTNKLQSLLYSLWSGNEMAASDILSDLLFGTISYMDYHEDFYHAFLSGIFVGRGYEVESNKEHGLGRPDIILLDRKNRRALIIEAKKAQSEESMESDCSKALDQISKREYAKSLKGFKQVMAYGIAFFEKQALVKKAFGI